MFPPKSYWIKKKKKIPRLDGMSQTRLKKQKIIFTCYKIVIFN